MSNCPNIKLSKCQIVNQIVKLSQYQMSCIIRVCRLTQRIDCVLFFRIFVCDGDSVRLNSSYFHSKYNYAVDGTTHSRTEKNKFKTLVIFKPLANRYGILSKTCCAKHCQIHAIIVLDKKCASSPPLPYPIALGAQHHLNPNTLGRPDLL